MCLFANLLTLEATSHQNPQQEEEALNYSTTLPFPQLHKLKNNNHNLKS